ncbi:MAG TPA: hypothetical protein VG818_13570 [Gemmatimonadaceae bacterium]|nr:hypothetical protein [Gemmatimonadaceae bacterium]
MNHRHLLPDEIDLLLDDEVGFGVAPLRDHVRDCASCQARLSEARAVLDALDELPQFAPSFNFADKVMSQVPVFVPWHVAARDTVRRYVPQSRPMRVAAAGVAATAGAALTGGAVWLAARGDLLTFVTGLAGDQVRSAVADAARSAIASLLGPDALAAVQHSGVTGLALAAAGFVVAAALSAFGLRAIAASTRRED